MYILIADNQGRGNKGWGMQTSTSETVPRCQDPFPIAQENPTQQNEQILCTQTTYIFHVICL